MHLAGQSDTIEQVTRKGERTRAKLIDATIRELGHIGYEATSILLITKTAKVSNATFYLYFRNKDAIIDAAIIEPAAQILRRVYEVEQGEPEFLKRMLLALRSFFEFVVEDPRWARAMLATHAAVPRLRELLKSQGSGMLDRGIASGLFDIRGTAFEVDAIHSVLMTAIRQQIDGTAGPDVIDEFIDLTMRMLGVREPDLKPTR